MASPSSPAFQLFNNLRPIGFEGDLALKEMSSLISIL
jgi:hypothetical protein